MTKTTTPTSTGNHPYLITRRQTLVGAGAVLGGVLLSAAATVAPVSAATRAARVVAIADLPPVDRNRTFVQGWWWDTPFWDSENYSLFALGASFQHGMNVIFEPLAFYNFLEDKEVLWQAESYSYNADSTVLTITLRPGIMWSDGQTFTSDDVAYTINQLLTLEGETVSPVGGQLYSGGGKVQFAPELKRFASQATIVDDRTVQIQMRQPAPRFFRNFFTYTSTSGAFPIMPRHIWEGQDWSTFTNDDLAKGWPVTTGPFQVVQSTPQQKVFDRRDDWWGARTGLSQLPAMKRVIIVATGDDLTARTQMTINNDLDINYLEVDGIKTALDRNPKLTTQTGRQAPYGFFDDWPQGLYLNANVPPYDNPDVRWALSYFINRQQLVDTAGSGIYALRQLPMPPFAGLLPYFDSIKDLLAQYPTNELNLDKGAARLQKAGFTRGSDGKWLDNNGRPFVVQIDVSSYWLPFAQVITEQWRQAGVESELSTVPGDRFLGGKYIVTHSGHKGSISEPYDTLNLFRDPKSNGLNQSNWGNADFDKIVDQMANTSPSDTPTMMKLFHSAMELWLPASPTIQLFQWLQSFAYNETYWTNFPSRDNLQDGNYMNAATQMGGWLYILTKLKPVGQ